MIKKLKKEIFSEIVRLKIILQGLCPRADHIESLDSRNLEHPRHFTIPNHGYQLINTFDPRSERIRKDNPFEQCG